MFLFYFLVGYFVVRYVFSVRKYKHSSYYAVTGNPFSLCVSIRVAMVNTVHT